MPACKLCGVPLEYMTLPSGKVAPMQKVTMVYERSRGEGVKLVAQRELWVNHFQTCPGILVGPDDSGPKQDPLLQ